MESAPFIEEKESTGSAPELVVDVKGVTKDDVTIILPVLNEESAIGDVLDELVSHGYRKILVVDGYSTDSTLQNAKKFGIETIHQHGIGKAGAVKTALEQVRTPYLMIMDGDYTYCASDIERFLFHADNYDEIIGSRQKSRENMSLLHRLGNRVINRSFNLLMGTALSDVCSGMYLLNTTSVKQLDLRTRGFNVEVEIAAQMALQGNVTEVPISYRRRVGKQKLSTWRHGVSILSSILKLARIYNPAFLFSLVAASAAFPGLLIMLWILVQWTATGVFHSGWALAGAILFLFALQALAVGTVAVLLNHMETRITKRIRQSLNKRSS